MKSAEWYAKQADTEVRARELFKQALTEAYEAGQRVMQNAAQEAIRNNFGAGLWRANEIIRSVPIQQMPAGDR